MDDWQLKAMPVVRLERTKSNACVSFLLHVSRAQLWRALVTSLHHTPML